MPIRPVLAAVLPLVLILIPQLAVGGIGMDSSEVTLMDTQAPQITLDPLPVNLLIQGGQTYTFQWAAEESNPGPLAQDRLARVLIDGQVQEEITWQDFAHVWEWGVPEAQTSDCFLEVVFRDALGNTTVARSESFTILLSTTDAPPPVGSFQLGAPYPNPFNPSCRLVFSLPAPDEVVVVVFDARGRLVRELFRGLAPAGMTRLEWNGADHQGRPQPAGMYFFSLESPGRDRQVRRAMLIP